MRSALDQSLWVYDKHFTRVSRIGRVVVDGSRGAFDVSPDGRHVVYSRDSTTRMHDRADGSDWLAVDNGGGRTLCPTFSPDGAGLALLNYSLVTFKPHVLPWRPGATAVVGEEHEIPPNDVVECVGRMGWVA